MDGHVDGNALAGLMSDIFAFDVTTAKARCMSCGEVRALAQDMVYGGEQGYVVRCQGCGDVLMVVVPEPGGVRMQMRGMSWLETPI